MKIIRLLLLGTIVLAFCGSADAAVNYHVSFGDQFFIDSGATTLSFDYEVPDFLATSVSPNLSELSSVVFGNPSFTLLYVSFQAPLVAEYPRFYASLDSDGDGAQDFQISFGVVGPLDHFGLYENPSLKANFVNITETAPVPEPSTLLLLGSGLVGLVGYGTRRMKN